MVYSSSDPVARFDEERPEVRQSRCRALLVVEAAGPVLLHSSALTSPLLNDLSHLVSKLFFVVALKFVPCTEGRRVVDAVEKEFHVEMARPHADRCRR